MATPMPCRSILNLKQRTLVGDEVGEGGVGCGKEVLGGEAELEASLAGTAEDEIVVGEGLVHPGRQGFFHADG